MNGKGDKRRPCQIPKAELELRDKLWRAPEAEKPAILAQIDSLVNDRAEHEIHSAQTKADSSY